MTHLLLLEPGARAKLGATASVGCVDPAPIDAVPALAAAGSEQRWSQLQRLRRGAGDLDRWIAGLAAGQIPPDADLLAALWARLAPQAVARLLASSAVADPAPWLEAGLLELPALTFRPEVRLAWLQPLLRRASGPEGVVALAWLQLAGHFRDPAVAELLRRRLLQLGAQGGDPDHVAPLLPLLGSQRDPQDAALLQQWALAPRGQAVRRSALEGLAVGLTAWPVEPLARDLQMLASDLDPVLAARAVDLLARLAVGQRCLRSLLARALDAGVRNRVLRYLRPSPLVLVVHGRQGGVIPPALLDLAAELERHRGVPVLLQALTAAAPQPSVAFQQAAHRAGGATLVPLLLLPGSHARVDVPGIAAHWRQAVGLRVLPFLGAWPAWQRALAEELTAIGGSATPVLLHHPLAGPLAARYLGLLEQRCGCRCIPAPYSAADPADLALSSFLAGDAAVLPLALAANRLCERLGLPALLERPRLRQGLLRQLEVLP